MKIWPFAYTLAMQMDPVVFEETCKTLETVPGIQKVQPPFEDVLDGSQYQMYHLHGQELLVSSDWDIGIVMVESEMELDEVLPNALIKTKRVF